MKKYFFDDLAAKYSLSKQVKIEDEIMNLEKELSVRKSILEIAETRDKSIEYWNSHTPEERANFGKSEAEINGTAKYRSVIDYGSVSNQEFNELSDFWKAAFLTATTKFFQDGGDQKCGQMKTGTKGNMTTECGRNEK